MADGEHHHQGAFDMATWAEGHEKLDNARFDSLSKDVGRLVKIVGIGITVLLGVTGWSLKTNYENADRQIQAIQQLKR